MQLTADQELRRELLLFSLSKHSDLEAAIKSAAEMERFVLRGCGADTSAGVGFIADDAIETPSSGGRDTFHDDDCRTLNGHGATASGQNGAARKAPAADEWAEDSCVGRKRRWSEADDQSLRRLWHSNHSLEEIAEAMGRTTPSLYSRARALGMAKRSPTTAERSEATPAKRGREPSDAAGTSAGADDEGDTPGESKRPAGSLSKSRTAVGLKRPSPDNVADSAANGGSRRNGATPTRSYQDGTIEAGVDPIVHFLRSRDYSVVRVEDGRFRVDGRRVLNADELREKANQVRQSMGKPPFAPQSAGSPG